MDTPNKMLLLAAAGAVLALPALFVAQRPTPGATPGATPSPTRAEATTPGLVSWHPDFDAAVRAARRSAKPVLLFQLLGDLDQTFC